MNVTLLGDNLRLARIKRGYSQGQAAKLCGISEKTFGKIERAQARDFNSYQLSPIHLFDAIYDRII